MGEWVKALGIDYGDARIGLAVSDDLGMLAHPLKTVAGHDQETAAVEICEVVSVRGIEDMIVGLPLRSDGTEGDAVAKVRRFLKVLVPRLPETIRIHEVDESFTTQVAMEKLHAVGRTEKNTRHMIDQAAAVEILQTWLDRQAEENAFLPPDHES
ncbi:MAG: Holliday junction resolvase RuvX [Verrucomicrobiales bacterium]|jgi:putative Holliday junction resolvase|nr:Holliday junction resolvase RuvX [Verrucomicrobiales bacterium]